MWLLMSTLKLEIVKYAVVGFSNLLLTFAIYSILLKIFHIEYLKALGLTWIVAVLFTYTLNFIWVFAPESQIKFNARFLKFCSTQIVLLTINMTVLKLSVERLDADPLYAQALLVPMLVIINFFSSKFWSLRKETI